MTPERAKELLPVFTAFAEGKTIEACVNRFDCLGSKWIEAPDPSWNMFHSYRVKPTTTAKLRAWKPEEVPVGAVLRQKANHANKSIISGMVNRKCFIGVWDCPTLFMAEDCEHSIDGGKTWLPCGVMTEDQP